MPCRLLAVCFNATEQNFILMSGHHQAASVHGLLSPLDTSPVAATLKEQVSAGTVALGLGLMWMPLKIVGK